VSDNIKPGDLLLFPEIDEDGDIIGPYTAEASYIGVDGVWEDPGPFMVMKTARTNEGRLLVQVQLLSELDEYRSDDPNNGWDYVDEYGYRPYKAEPERAHQTHKYGPVV
jgi:hypothetical protein